jgi:thiosulfate/3-mercaptopyruvate sulfurtransferase
VRPLGGTVVSTEWVAEHLGEPGLCVADVRGKVLPPGNVPRYVPSRDAYEADHVPGAVFVDWTRDIVNPLDPIPVQIAEPEAFAEAMTRLGINDETLVVAYDDYNHIFAGRLAWALRYYGHDAVRIMDGGWSRWISEGRPTERAIPRRADGRSGRRFSARPRPELRRTADQVAAVLHHDDVLVLDARPSDQYVGAISAAARAGHIPGARNVPYARLIDRSTGKFLPRTELESVFAAAGIDVARLPREVIVYCNGGVSCTVPLEALRMLGREDVAVYDGSWNEWGNDESRPLRSGPEP